MIRFLLIFALLFACREDDNILICGCEVRFSDALPVQFWLTACQTFNEKEVDGVFSRCFCQPFNCDDEITIQLKDSDIGQNYKLHIILEGLSDGAQLLTNAEFETDLSGWTQDAPAGASFDFDWNAAFSGSAFNAIAFEAANYNSLYYQAFAQALTAGTQVRVTTALFFENSIRTSSSITFDVVLMNSGTVVHTLYSIVQDASNTNIDGTYVIDETVTLTGTVNQVGLKITHPGVTTANQTDIYIKNLKAYTDQAYTAQEISFNELGSGIYNISITPKDYNICDTLMQLLVFKNGTEVAKSDCLSIKEDHEETVLINYHNNRIFASLNSTVGTPDPEFNLRIPAIFSESDDRYTRESESLDLSNNQSLQLMAEIKRQRLLKIKHMPSYMHIKTVLALSFQTVTIDDILWKLDGGHEKATGNPKFPLKTAQVWLTDRNYILRNVL